MVASGKSTSNADRHHNLDRQKRVAFSPVIFVAAPSSWSGAGDHPLYLDLRASRRGHPARPTSRR